MEREQVIDTVRIAIESVEFLPPSRERSIALTKLEEAEMWLRRD